ncbi:hypothetical protein BHE74_00001570 [Ensete ventricosum]|nr:hypothetical protein GW17_00009418 [Ensete ventricosum]RWW89482.1 hypothetical protein BHE74_00001570 [Ensete ventricosum]RZS13792.1 hypothetical protein BHM03_00045417 [Ensete ventricosum]
MKDEIDKIVAELLLIGHIIHSICMGLRETAVPLIHPRPRTEQSYFSLWRYARSRLYPMLTLYKRPLHSFSRGTLLTHYVIVCRRAATLFWLVIGFYKRKSQADGPCIFLGYSLKVVCRLHNPLQL